MNEEVFTECLEMTTKGQFRTNSNFSKPFSKSPHVSLSSSYHGDRKWSRSKFRFRMQTLIFLLAMGLPGNLFTFYCHLTPNHNVETNDSWHLENVSTPTMVSVAMNISDVDFPCYEDINEWESKLEKIRYWIEGILLSMVGITGFLGEFGLALYYLFCILISYLNIQGYW